MVINPFKSVFSAAPVSLSDIESELATQDIRLVVQRKSVKNINFRVKPNIFYVSAPKRISDFELAKVVLTRIDWAIQANQQLLEKQKNQPHIANKSYQQGDNILLWGNHYQLALDQSNTAKSYVEINETTSTITCFLTLKHGHTPSNTHVTPQNVLQTLITEQYRTELARTMPALFAKWQPIVGKAALETRIKKMTTRWGSCNVTKARVWLSLYLAQFPVQCTEYVIVHELCHLHEANHSKRFWNHVESAMPDYKTWHNYLKGTGKAID